MPDVWAASTCEHACQDGEVSFFTLLALLLKDLWQHIRHPGSGGDPKL